MVTSSSTSYSKENFNTMVRIGGEYKSVGDVLIAYSAIVNWGRGYLRRADTVLLSVLDLGNKIGDLGTKIGEVDTCLRFIGKLKKFITNLRKSVDAKAEAKADMFDPLKLSVFNSYCGDILDACEYYNRVLLEIKHYINNYESNKDHTGIYTAVRDYYPKSLFMYKPEERGEYVKVLGDKLNNIVIIYSMLYEAPYSERLYEIIEHRKSRSVFYKGVNYDFLRTFSDSEVVAAFSVMFPELRGGTVVSVPSKEDPRVLRYYAVTRVVESAILFGV